MPFMTPPTGTPSAGRHPLVIVPLRAGKTRLSSTLDPDSRADLRAAMLDDVIRAARGADLHRLVVAAGDEESAAFAHELGVAFHRDPVGTSSLDEAISHAAATGEPDDDVLVVTADLPALTSDDLLAVLDAPGKVVIAPTSDGGTGALLRRPRGVIATAYGPESAALHAARALDAGTLPTILTLPGFLVDVDTAEDLDALAHADQLGAATRHWLSTARVRVD